MTTTTPADPYVAAASALAAIVREVARAFEPMVEAFNRMVIALEPWMRPRLRRRFRKARAIAAHRRAVAARHTVPPTPWKRERYRR